jgi:predicted RNA-binding Zn-ribbon protein involved in translation (DUF1610 family)
MMKFPNPQMARLQAILGAVASWFFIAWLACLPFLISRSYLQVGLIMSAVLWLVVVCIALTLKCPSCGKSVAVTTKRARLTPDWSAGRKQLFPIEALLGKPIVHACPHCGTKLSFE